MCLIVVFSDHLCSKVSNIEQTTCNIEITVVFIADAFFSGKTKSVDKTCLRFDKLNHSHFVVRQQNDSLISFIKS